MNKAIPEKLPRWYHSMMGWLLSHTLYPLHILYHSPGMQGLTDPDLLTGDPSQTLYHLQKQIRGRLVQYSQCSVYSGTPLYRLVRSENPGSHNRIRAPVSDHHN